MPEYLKHDGGRSPPEGDPPPSSAIIFAEMCDDALKKESLEGVIAHLGG
ncbi:hypothetical protein ART_2154 [Arthrobacter sp. PAMC 25486]|nr:hypothetical protein ART_2154 [Arthrobacter sp. PAMC 25486]